MGPIQILVWLINEIKTLWHICFSPIKGDTHKARLESFYSTQAGNYDAYRKRLLHGREQMLQLIPEVREGAVWVDLGCGTGYNAEYMASIGRLSSFSKVYLIDLSPSLLKVAKERVEAAGWDNVECVEADATTFIPKEEIDLVTFSYSLTMIPPWFKALNNAKRMLRENGIISIADFYTNQKYPEDGLKKHSTFSRLWWPSFFMFDNVFLNADHLPFLRYHFEQEKLIETNAPVPYIPFIRVPRYIFVGRKTED